jgi:hypothetical protein
MDSVRDRTEAYQCDTLSLAVINLTFARKHLKQNSEYQKRHYDLKAVKRTLLVGKSVWLYDASKKVGVCRQYSFLLENQVDGFRPR